MLRELKCIRTTVSNYECLKLQWLKGSISDSLAIGPIKDSLAFFVGSGSINDSMPETMGERTGERAERGEKGLEGLGRRVVKCCLQCEIANCARCARCAHCARSALPPLLPSPPCVRAAFPPLPSPLSTYSLKTKVGLHVQSVSQHGQ